MCLICKIDLTGLNKTLRQHLNEKHEIPLETYNILNKIPNLKLRLDLKDPLETKSENCFLNTQVPANPESNVHSNVDIDREIFAASSDVNTQLHTTELSTEYSVHSNLRKNNEIFITPNEDPMDISNASSNQNGRDELESSPTIPPLIGSRDTASVPIESDSSSIQENRSQTIDDYEEQDENSKILVIQQLIYQPDCKCRMSFLLQQQH